MIPTTDAPQPCRSNSKLFHAPRGEGATGNNRKRRIDAAKALCRMCPVMLDCRNYGRQTGEPGIWGGETEQERAAAGFKSRRHGTSVPKTPEHGTEAGEK